MKEHSLRIYCESLYQPGEIGIIVEFYTKKVKILELECILENIYVKLFLLIFVPILSGGKLKP